MYSIRLIHWKAKEVQSKVDQLIAAGYLVEYGEFRGVETFRQVREQQPSAIIIDLSRLPSQGRDVALGFRENKGTRFIPIVFVDGAPDKIQKVRESLPDAHFTIWEKIGEILQLAIQNPPENPIVPKSRLDGYSGAPLIKKLGIKSQMVVSALNAPQNFTRTIGDLPEGAQLISELKPDSQLILWFEISLAELERRMNEISRHLHHQGSLWICWPKKASGIETDLTQNIVRQIGLARGLVDYKICAIDQSWAGLCFAIRK